MATSETEIPTCRWGIVSKSSNMEKDQPKKPNK